MKVHRYEHRRTKMGPYSQYWHNDDRLHHAHSGSPRHPNPHKSFGDAVPKGFGWVCGCDTRSSLRKWFWGFNKDVQKVGFVVREYDVPDDNVVGPDEFGQVIFWGGEVVS